MTLLDEGPVVTEAPARFTVRLDNFTGPFDLLLQLIGKHQLDVTELALHRVTDDFIAHLTALGDDADLDETSEFLVIAATLLDLKAARLLPDAEANTEDGDDGLLEARDLLFARLLQYRAYKQVAGLFVELEATALRRFPRSVALEERFAGLLPEVLLGVDPARFADLAAAVLRPKPPPDRRRRPPARPGRLRRRARRDPAGTPGGAGGGDVRRADRRLHVGARGDRPVHGGAGAVPGGDDRAGPAGVLRRADGALDPARGRPTAGRTTMRDGRGECGG